MKNILNNEKQKIYLENIKKQKLKNDLFKISEYIKKID